VEGGEKGVEAQEDTALTKYIVHATGIEHEITAHTYVNGSDGLRFVGSDGVTVAIFTTFDWMKLVPVTA
jgi:hypothetical protein